MDRLACISVPSLALQIALRRFQEGDRSPVVLVKDDRPFSPILYLNRTALNLGLQPGLRYSEALSLVPELRAVTVSEADVAEVQREILILLRRWSPQVEACPFDASAFWVGASGLQGLFGSEAQWGAALRAALKAQRLRSVIVVGSTRAGTWALARTRRRSTVVRSEAAELWALDQAPLSVLPLSSRHRRLLEKLGVTTLANVLKIPAEEWARRLGPELVRDLRGLEALRNLPLQGDPPEEEVVRVVHLESPITDRQALLEPLLNPLADALEQLIRQARLLCELRLVFLVESGELLCEVLRPAEPTNSLAILRRLLDLRLQRCAFPTAVAEIRLKLEHVALPASTGELFAPEVVRDLRRGAEALALLRAQWGNAAVVHAVVCDSHVPELSYRWEPVERLTVPRPTAPQLSQPTAVRRVKQNREPHEGNPAGERRAPSLRLRVVTGGHLIDREYWFLRNRRNETSWVSRDLITGNPRWEGMVD